jgi:protein SCO1/2
MRYLVFTIFIIVILPGTPSAQIVQQDLPELKKIDVQEHLGRQIPLDLTFTDTHGRMVRLGDYFHKGKPVLLSLFYATCPMLCHVVLEGVATGVRTLAWTPGDEFDMISVSFDHRDTLELVRDVQARTVALLKEGTSPESWHFLFGPESHSKALADSLGFIYYYQPENGQWAHPAVLFVLTEEGIISRYLYGVNFKERDLRLALLEASQGKLGSTIDRIILYCYHYDPDAKGYVALAGNIMKLGGVATVIIMALILGTFWLRESSRRMTGKSQTGR